MPLTATAATDATTELPHLATSVVKFQRLLLAIDFSSQTPQVLNFALQIAAIFHSELYLVSAANPAVYGTGAEPIPIETFEVNREIAEALMKELVDGSPDLARFQHHEIVTYADAAELIQSVTKDHDIDLVIAGSHGASGISRLALGSVAERIVHAVRCPVLMLGPHAEVQTHPFNSILVGASLRVTDLRSAQYAASLAEQFHGELTLLHACERAEETLAQPELLEEHLLSRLQLLVPSDFATHATAVTHVEHGKPGAVIVSLALSLCPSLIVLGAREDTTLSDHNPWSTLAEVIQHVHCPVLCVQHHFR